MATNIYGSDMPADNCYGENGYTGPVSLRPGDAPVSCDLVVSKGNYVPPNTQTRDVGMKPLAVRTGPGAIAKWK
jgi:hypothetical protein